MMSPTSYHSATEATIYGNHFNLYSKTCFLSLCFFLLSTLPYDGFHLFNRNLSLFCRFIGPGRTHWGIVITLAGSTVSLILFQLTSTWGWIFNVVFMLMAGICNCGPDAFVSGSIAAELGERENAQSAVSGFVNGMFFFIPHCIDHFVNSNIKSVSCKLLVAPSKSMHLFDVRLSFPKFSYKLISQCDVIFIINFIHP